MQLHQVRLTQEISELRKQAEALNAPATYAKCAKYQRLALAKERELASLQTNSRQTASAMMGVALAVVQVRHVRGQLRPLGVACAPAGALGAPGRPFPAPPCHRRVSSSSHTAGNCSRRPHRPPSLQSPCRCS